MISLPKSPKRATQIPQTTKSPKTANTNTNTPLNVKSKQSKTQPKTIQNPKQSSNVTLKSPNSIKETNNELNKILLDKTTSETPTNQPIITQSFATATAKQNLPKKNQAILINIKDNADTITQKEYVMAIAKITSPKNIIFISRISKDRLCIFLSNKNWVDELINNHETILIKDVPIKIRRYYNPNKRIIISNVCPTIPNEIILQTLQSINIIPVSAITNIGAGIHEVGFEHILSFRRQMYIIPDDFEKLPSSVVITHENTNYRIFMTDDQLTCFTCHQKNHTSSRCPLNKSTTNIAATVNLNDINDTTIINQIAQIDNTHDKPFNVDNVHINDNISDDTLFYINDPIPTSQIAQFSNIQMNTQPIQEYDKIINTDNNQESRKRKANSSIFLSESQSSKEIINDTTQSDYNTEKKSNKIMVHKEKKKSKFSDNIDELLEPTRLVYNNKKNIPLTFEQFKHLIENIQGHPSPLEVIKKYEIDSKQTIETLELIRPELKSVSAKNNITRITNKIFEETDSFQTVTDSGSDT